MGCLPPSKSTTARRAWRRLSPFPWKMPHWSGPRRVIVFSIDSRTSRFSPVEPKMPAIAHIIITTPFKHAIVYSVSPVL